jgi:shikimate kinase
MNKDVLKSHKYNCAVWLQSVDKQIKEQRAVVARLWIALERYKNDYELKTTRKEYKNEYDKLQNLYLARAKLYEEQQKLNVESSRKVAIK